MRRLLFLLLGCAGLAAAEPGERDPRLGELIRWYLAEPSPARRDDLIESIRGLVQDDPKRVLQAIREGWHFKYPARPELAKGGPPPVFHNMRTRVQPVASCAGDFATLTLPEGYDPARAHVLVVDVGVVRARPPAGAVRLAVDVTKHRQAKDHAQWAEALVLSLLAHTLSLAHIDADRVFLRGQGAFAELAWYIAVHNPDRFAGLCTLEGFWKDAARLVDHGAMLAALTIERPRGNAALRKFMGEMRRRSARHVLLQAPEDRRDDPALLPRIDEWMLATRREEPRRQVDLVCTRDVALRAFWVAVTPKSRSVRRQWIASKRWEHRQMSLDGRLTVRQDAEDRNLLRVTTDRVAGFEVYVDPRRFPGDTLRVSINGGVPVARVIDLDLAELLEDYRERRDPGLLYCCRLSFSARGP